jgi:tetratricopeptide (TPR) repeat protein
MPAPVQLKYRAFLSYARADLRCAKWLHGQLEGFRIDRDLVGRETSHGIVPKTLRPIFRDQEDFSGGDTLADATVSAIDHSAALLVLCSTVSATRPVVNEEVRLFRWRHPDRPVIPVMIDGTFPDNYPPALRFEIGSDGGITDRPVTILAPDLREEADGRQLGLAKIVSGLIGVDSDDVYRRAERARRNAARIRNAVIAVLVALTIASTSGAIMYRRELHRSTELLDSTLAQFTGYVDAGVKSSANAMPLAVTRFVLKTAEGTLTSMTEDGRNSPPIQHRKAVMLSVFSDNYRDLGQAETAALRLEEAQKIMAGLVSAAPSNKDYLFTTAQLHGKAAYLLSARGDHSGSVREYQARHQIMTRLAPSNPGNASWQLEYALSRASLVDTYSMRDATTTQIVGYREGLAVIERLAAAEPDNAELQRQLGISFTSIGLSLLQQGNLAGAQENIAKALAVDEKLATAQPNNAGLKRDLAKSRLTMASLRNVLEDGKGALPIAESGRALLRGLTSVDPDNAALQSDLGFADMVVAILQAETDTSDGSLTLARSARDNVARLAASDPGNVNLRQQIAMFDIQLGDLLSKSDQSQAALAIFKSARLNFQRLNDQDPASGMNQLMLVFLDARIAKALTKAGDPKPALDSYRSAAEGAAKLVRTDPENMFFQTALADSLRDLGLALVIDNKADEALPAFQTELAARRKIAATDATKVSLQAQVLEARTRMAEALYMQGKTAEASEINRGTIADAEHLVETAPDASSVASALAPPSAILCDTAVRHNDQASALSSCTRALELYRKLVGLEPNNAGYGQLMRAVEAAALPLQLKAANDAGRYAEALVLQTQIVALVESEESKPTGRPGPATAEALAILAGQALLAGEPEKAITASERSLALRPGDLTAELNRAHALMYLDRGAEALTIYEKHKADLFSDNTPWTGMVADDFAEFRKAGHPHPLMGKVEAALGIAGKP